MDFHSGTVRLETLLILLYPSHSPTGPPGRYKCSPERGSLLYRLLLHVGVLVQGAGTTGFYKRGVAQCWVPSTQGTACRQCPSTYLADHILPNLQLPGTDCPSSDQQTNPITEVYLMSDASLFNNGSQRGGGQRQLAVFISSLI